MSAPTGYRRAEPRTSGTHFAALTDDHMCRAACYRVSRHRGKEYISTLCDAGHSVSMRLIDTGFGGSAFHASLNELPVFAPFVALTSEPE